MSAEPRALYPLSFEPVLKGYPWGGRAIGELLGRQIPPGPIAESWEISAHPDGSTVAANGPLRGRDLPSLFAEYGELLVGTSNAEALARNRFPLLIKLLDAKEWLSVQVHPDDSYALALEDDLGKSEMWIVLAAEPGAEILIGFKAGVDPTSFRKAISSGKIADLLHRTPARPGDVFFVPPGTIHAIGPGILLAEIQQSSNVTYRVFDWNRRPARPLHLENALQVIDFDAVEPGPIQPRRRPGTDREVLAHCLRFSTERLRIGPDEEIAVEPGGESFEIWGTLEGDATVEGGEERVTMSGVSWILVPACVDRCGIRATTQTTLIRVRTPSRS